MKSLALLFITSIALFPSGYASPSFVEAADNSSIEERIKALNSDNLDEALLAVLDLIALRDSGVYIGGESSIMRINPDGIHFASRRMALRTKAEFALYRCDNIPLRIKAMKNQKVELRIWGSHGCSNLLRQEPNAELVESLRVLATDPSTECRAAAMIALHSFRRFGVNVTETMYKVLENENGRCTKAEVSRDNGRKSRVIRRGPRGFRRHRSVSHL